MLFIPHHFDRYVSSLLFYKWSKDACHDLVTVLDHITNGRAQNESMNPDPDPKTVILVSIVNGRKGMEKRELLGIPQIAITCFHFAAVLE